MNIYRANICLPSHGKSGG